jgi:hypothetical protein
MPAPSKKRPRPGRAGGRSWQSCGRRRFGNYRNHLRRAVRLVIDTAPMRATRDLCALTESLDDLGQRHPLKAIKRTPLGLPRFTSTLAGSVFASFFGAERLS